jgi:hypothetical protein
VKKFVKKLPDFESFLDGRPNPKELPDSCLLNGAFEYSVDAKEVRDDCLVTGAGDEAVVSLIFRFSRLTAMTFPTNRVNCKFGWLSTSRSVTLQLDSSKARFN